MNFKSQIIIAVKRADRFKLKSHTECINVTIFFLFKRGTVKILRDFY